MAHELITIEKGLLAEIIYQYGQSSSSNERKIDKIIDEYRPEDCKKKEWTWEEFYEHLDKMSGKDTLELTKKIFV